MKHFWGFQWSQLLQEKKKKMNNTYRGFVTDKKDRRKDVYEHECVFILKGAEGKAWDTQEDD